jgi:hypothetical protein
MDAHITSWWSAESDVFMPFRSIRRFGTGSSERLRPAAQFGVDDNITYPSDKIDCRVKIAILAVPCELSDYR